MINWGRADTTYDAIGRYMAGMCWSLGTAGFCFVPYEYGVAISVCFTLMLVSIFIWICAWVHRMFLWSKTKLEALQNFLQGMRSRFSTSQASMMTAQMFNEDDVDSENRASWQGLAHSESRDIYEAVFAEISPLERAASNGFLFGSFFLIHLQLFLAPLKLDGFIGWSWGAVLFPSFMILFISFVFMLIFMGMLINYTINGTLSFSGHRTPRRLLIFHLNIVVLFSEILFLILPEGALSSHSPLLQWFLNFYVLTGCWIIATFARIGTRLHKQRPLASLVPEFGLLLLLGVILWGMILLQIRLEGKSELNYMFVFMPWFLLEFLVVLVMYIIVFTDGVPPSWCGLVGCSMTPLLFNLLIAAWFERYGGMEFIYWTVVFSMLYILPFFCGLEVLQSALRLSGLVIRRK